LPNTATGGAAAIKHHKNKNDDSGEAASGWQSEVELEWCLFIYLLLYSASLLPISQQAQQYNTTNNARREHDENETLAR